MPDLFHAAERDASYTPYVEAVAADLNRYTIRYVMTDDSVTLTSSLQNDAGGNPPLARIRVLSSGAGGNHREFFLRPDALYTVSEIRSVIFGGGTWADADTRTQQGNVHACQKVDGGRIRAFVAWHDTAAGAPGIVNVGIWESDGTHAGLNLYYNNANLSLTPNPVVRPVMLSSRATNVVSVTLAGRHDLLVNDSVTTSLETSGLNGTTALVTAVSGQTVSYSNAGADVAAGGPGTLVKTGAKSAFPYVLDSRLLEGGTFQAKIWRLGDIEPTWDGLSAVTYSGASQVSSHARPVGPGMCGFYVGHVNNGEDVKFGLPQIVGY